MHEVWGIPWEWVRWAALPAGGGVGRSQSLCGAANGGGMAIGLRLGQRGLARHKLTKEARARAKDMMQSFRETFGDVDCSELTGHDLNDPDEYAKWKKSGLREERCVKYVGWTVKYLMENDNPNPAQ